MAQPRCAQNEEHVQFPLNQQKQQVVVAQWPNGNKGQQNWPVKNVHAVGNASDQSCGAPFCQSTQPEARFCAQNQDQQANKGTVDYGIGPYLPVPIRLCDF